MANRCSSLTKRTPQRAVIQIMMGAGDRPAVPGARHGLRAPHRAGCGCAVAREPSGYALAHQFEPGRRGRGETVSGIERVKALLPRVARMRRFHESLVKAGLGDTL